MFHINLPKSCRAAAGVLLVGSSLLFNGCAQAGSPKGYTEMSPEQLAEYLIFEQRGFDLDAKTQEGGTVRDRLTQDSLQRACSQLKGRGVDGATAKKVTALARDAMSYPDGGIRLGDWKKGQQIAHNAFGYRVGHKVDDHSKKTPGGMCINCHVMDPEGDLPGGSLGPSLTNYGTDRGRSDAVLKYTYEVIYNPHASFPCTKMPRMGANGVLDKEQILHVMAYLLDPKSPVNN